MKRDIYEAITERFIEQLKRGTVPWQKPWFAVQNIVSRKPYRGINALLLGSTDYQSPFWISFRQALDLGGHVKKGEKSTPVIYYKILEKRDEAGNMMVREDGRPSRIPFVRWANVFNLDQTEGIQAPAITTSQSVTQPHKRAAGIVENAKLCPIHHAGFAACYSPRDDVIRILSPSTFHSQEDYYHTLYHELTHNAETGIMPHGLRWSPVCRVSAMRVFGIIRVHRGTRGVGHRVGSVLAATPEQRRGRGPFPLSACRRGCKLGWSQLTHVRARGLSQLDQPVQVARSGAASSAAISSALRKVTSRLT